MPESGWKKLSAEELRLAQTWYKNGVSPLKCAERLGRDKSTLTRRLVQNKAIKKQGAPKKLTEAQVDFLVRRLDELIKKAKGEYHVTVQKLKRSTRCKASERCILTALHKRKIFFRKMREKPLLTEDDIKERFKFAKKYRGKTARWWKSVIKGHIDGKWFKVYLSAKMRSLAAKHATWGVYRGLGKGLEGAYVKPKKENKKNNTGAKSSLVVAGIGNGKLFMWHTVPTGRWSGKAAAEMYESSLRPTLEKAWGSKGRFLVLEDNDPTGFKSGKGIDAKARSNLDVFKIPNRSPDLSVMDYAVWKQINLRMRAQEKTWKNKRETREAYLERLRKTAMGLPASFINDSVGDMVRRCQKLYEAKGGYFEEGGRRGC